MNKDVIERAKKLLDSDPEVARYFMEVGVLLSDPLGRVIVKMAMSNGGKGVMVRQRKAYQLDQESAQIYANDRWIRDNYKHLMKQYPNEWIAVNDSIVIDHDADDNTLEKKLREKYGKIDSIAVAYIPDKPFLRSGGKRIVS